MARAKEDWSDFDSTGSEGLETVVVCPLTSKLHPLWRCRLQVSCVGKSSEIAVDQIRTISKKRLKKKIDHLSTTDATLLRELIVEMYWE